MRNYLFIFSLLSFSVVFQPKEYYGKWKVVKLALNKEITKDGEELDEFYKNFVKKNAFKFVKLKKQSIEFISYQNKISDQINYTDNTMKFLADTLLIFDKSNKDKYIKLLEIEPKKKMMLFSKAFNMELEK